MSRLLPFASPPPPETRETLSTLANDLQILALDRYLLGAVARYAHHLAMRVRVTIAAETPREDDIA